VRAATNRGCPPDLEGLIAFGIYRKYFVSPRLRSLLVQIFIFYFTFSAYIYGFALFAERRFTYAGKPLNPQQIGYAFAYFRLLGIILQGFLLGPLVRRFGERRLVLYSFTACIVGYLALSVTINALVSTQAMPAQSKSPEPATNNIPWLQPCHTAAEKRGPPTDIKVASHRLWHI
jgi:MFS family permease